RGPGGYYQPEDWSPDGKSLLVSRTESSFNHDLYLIDVPTGQTRHLTPHKGNVQYESPCWSADGKRIYCVSTAEDHDLAGLAAIDVASGKLTYLWAPDHEVEAVYVSPFEQKDRLCTVLNVEGRSELRLNGPKPKPPLKLPGLGTVGTVRFSPNGLQ